jgi:type II secretory pathway pseudopilin PulG
VGAASRRRDCVGIPASCRTLVEARTPQSHTPHTRTPSHGARSGFTLVDLLVSLTVVAVLIGILLPSLSGVRESTRRVVCSSNVRQQGYGISLYAEDNRDALPPSLFINQHQWDRTTTVRLNADAIVWDGLGWLFASDYLNSPAVFYCPSHTGEHPYSAYASTWNQTSGEIIINYQYRGPRRAGDWLSHLSVEYPTYALVADGMRTRDDFNHKVGSNVLRADLALFWYPDRDGRLEGTLPESAQDGGAAQTVFDAWHMLDGPQ